MNRLLAFYYGSHPDSHGRMLAEMLKQDDHWLEVCHNYIRWLFPTKEFSRVTPDAPILDKATIEAFRTDELLRNHLRAALIRNLSFYGIKLTPVGVIKRAKLGSPKVQLVHREHTQQFADYTRPQMLELAKTRG